MKIAVTGAGAMGSLFGGRLAMAGNDVTMIAVSPATIETINRDGIVLDDEAGRHVIPVKAKRAEDMGEKPELIMLFTKTLSSRAALEGARHYIGEGTYILTLQNGLGNIELISEYVGRDRIIAGVTNYASDSKGPGKISSAGSGYVKIMTADLRRSEFLDKVFRTFSDAGFHISIADDIYTAIWEKAGFNAAINAVTAVCCVPCGGVGSVEEGRRLAAKIAEETAMVANAYGVKASAESIIRNLENSYIAHKDHFTSMAQDVQKKKKTEVEFINGGIVKKAREKGIEVPYTEAVYDLLRIIEDTYEMQE